MNQYFDKVLRDTEKRYEQRKMSQCVEGKLAGAMLSEFHVPDVKMTANLAGLMTSLYITRESSYFQSNEVLGRVQLALDYIKSCHRENGLFDLYDCNFYSGPDTAFTLIPLYEIYRMIKDMPELAEVCQKTLSILEFATDGITKAGFHTPNHRWVSSAALMKGFTVFGKKEYKACAELYLAEGIDNTAYGEYAERSAGGYNIVNNEAMFSLAEETGDVSYYEYPRRNLGMMMHYIDPDGYIFTNNSTRQDRGKRVLPTEYFAEFLEIGFLFDNKDFLKQANQIWDSLLEKGQLAPDILTDFILKPQLSGENHYHWDKTPSYHGFFKESGIVRAAKNGFSYTLMEDTSSFLYFQAGSLVMAAKIGGCICQHKEFRPKEVVKTQTGYHLEYTMEGWYYLPFGKDVGTSDWWKMPNQQRQQLHGPSVTITVDTEEVDDGLDLAIQVSGIDGAPFRLEFGFDAGGELETNGLVMPASEGQIVTIKEGPIYMTKGDDVISIDGAFYNHSFVGGKFGSEARNPSLFHVYFTDTTPFSHKISIKKKAVKPICQF